MNTIFVALILNLISAPIVIILLRRAGFYKTKRKAKHSTVKRNPRYYGHLLGAMSTPSSFGILLIINLLVYLSFNHISLPSEMRMIVAAAVGLGLLGFIDDAYQFFLYEKVGRWGIRARYKILIQFAVMLFLFLSLKFSPLQALTSSLLATFILNSFNITDGLDGLAGGLLLPTFGYFLLLENRFYSQGDHFELLVLAVVFIFTFLVFNIKPAKVWLGDSGSYALGTLLAVFVLRYPLIYSLPVIAIFLIEGLSSLFQILSVKFTGRRLLTIAPLHLHLLNVGWSQWRVIVIAWIVQIAIIIFVLNRLIYAG
jgi:phospho-N-acetylmuramoyl-pentapeptide-transferase